MKDKKERRHSLRAKMIGINISITLTSFILCGVLFVLSVGFLVGKYVNHDLDFLLVEISDNLNVKTTYMENVVYDLRNSEEIMSYLQGVQAVAEEPEKLQATFHKVVNISSDKNRQDSSEPMCDKTYLYTNSGENLATFYYAMIYSEINESNLEFDRVYKEFVQKKTENRSEDSYCTQKENKIYVAHTLFDDNMKDCGTVIFEMNQKAVNSVMKEMDTYTDSFWFLYDKVQVLGGQGPQNIEEELPTLKGTYQYKPYSQEIDHKSYRLYTKPLAMGLAITVGIPENQAIFVLYDSMHIYIIGIIIVLLAGLVSFVIFTYKMTKPIKEVTAKMKKVQEGDFSTKLPDYDNEEFHEISQVFNEMTEYINHLVNQVYEKQISIKEMELKFLQTQMNPHFMFNVLNTIALQARMDGHEQLFKMIHSFSQLIQAKIYRNDKEKVQIKQELEYVDYYLYLQNFRYGERLQYHIDVVDKKILDMYMPKLCIQLIVENAVVHGIEPKVEAGEVFVRIYEENQSVYIDIHDDGVGFFQEGYIALPMEWGTEDAVHNHVGINNAHHIIRLMYGEEYGITLYSDHGTGTTVRIHIPFDEKEQEEETHAV